MSALREFWRGLTTWKIGDDAGESVAAQKPTDLLHLVIGPLLALVAVSMWGLMRLAYLETGSETAGLAAMASWLCGVAGASAWWLLVYRKQANDPPGEDTDRDHRTNNSGAALAALVLSAPWFWPGPLLALAGGLYGASIIGRRV